MSTDPHTRASARRSIIVGVVADQPPEVLQTAADFAERFDADLFCVQVDDSRYTVEIQPDGSLVTLPIHPDILAEAVPEFSPSLHEVIAEALAGREVRWSETILAGGPAQELSRLADDVDALMFVVGVRKAGLRGTLHEFAHGSVAVQLAHQQHRPLLVVPLAGEPTEADTGAVETGEAARTTEA